MKKLVVKMFAIGSILASAQLAHAISDVGAVICSGGGLKASVSYAVAVTDGASIKLKVQNSKTTLLDVSTDEASGQAEGLIHNAFTTSTLVDDQGNIEHYGNGAGPTRLLAFIGEGNVEPQLMDLNLEKKTITIGGRTTRLKCQDVDYQF